MWYNRHMDKAPTQKARVTVGVTPSDSPVYARFGQTIDVRIEKGVGPAILLRVEENGKVGGLVMVMPSGRVMTLTWSGEDPDETPKVTYGTPKLPVGVNLVTAAGVV